MTYPRQTLIRTAALAAELGVHRDTVSRWAQDRLRPAIFARGYFKVGVLRAMGILPTPEPEPEIIPHA